MKPGDLLFVTRNIFVRETVHFPKTVMMFVGYLPALYKRSVKRQLLLTSEGMFTAVSLQSYIDIRSVTFVHRQAKKC